jgi:hypothetical protein
MRGKTVDISNGTKPCSSCNSVKPISQFGQTKYTLTGLSVYCKACMAERARKYRATPEGKKAHYKSTLKWIGGLSGERAQGIKICPKCQIEKTFEQFPKNRRNKHGIASYCLSCSAEIVKRRRATPEGQQAHRDASKRWREANIERHADNNAKWTYGVKHGTYATMLAAQNGLCAICQSSNPGAGLRRFHIDHCHNSKEVRGLLCEQCNRGLGHFKDDPSLLTRAINYLSKDRVERAS